VREREMVVELEQPGVEGPVRQLGVPIKLSRTPGEHARLPGPALGEHTEEALLAAGYSQAQVAELLASGAAAAATPSQARAGSSGSSPTTTFRA
jgi:alpha-methylacyl-CoA racemase